MSDAPAIHAYETEGWPMDGWREVLRRREGGFELERSSTRDFDFSKDDRARAVSAAEALGWLAERGAEVAVAREHLSDLFAATRELIADGDETYRVALSQVGECFFERVHGAGSPEQPGLLARLAGAVTGEAPAPTPGQPFELCRWRTRAEVVDALREAGRDDAAIEALLAE